MDNKTLNNKLRDRARSLGLCDEWFSLWKPDSTQQQLIDKYKRGIDFAIKHNYPNNEFIKANFDRKLLLDNLVFVDETINIQGSNGVYIINGSCTGTLRFSAYSVARLHIRHDSKITIICKECAKIFISAYDNASIVVRAESPSKAYIYRKNPNATIQAQGNTIVHTSV